MFFILIGSLIVNYKSPIAWPFRTRQDYQTISAIRIEISFENPADLKFQMPFLLQSISKETSKQSGISSIEKVISSLCYVNQFLMSNYIVLAIKTIVYEQYICQKSIMWFIFFQLLTRRNFDIYRYVCYSQLILSMLSNNKLKPVKIVICWPYNMLLVVPSWNKVFKNECYWSNACLG